MGTTIMFMGLSEKKMCLQNKIHTFVALAPAVFIENSEVNKTLWDLGFLLESVG